MSKVQTFEEWHSERSTWFAIHGITIRDAKELFCSVMENAARVCDWLEDPYSKPLSPKGCALYIREAAKG